MIASLFGVFPSSWWTPSPQSYAVCYYGNQNLPPHPAPSLFSITLKTFCWPTLLLPEALHSILLHICCSWWSNKQQHAVIPLFVASVHGLPIQVKLDVSYHLGGYPVRWNIKPTFNALCLHDRGWVATRCSQLNACG